VSRINTGLDKSPLQAAKIDSEKEICGNISPSKRKSNLAFPASKTKESRLKFLNYSRAGICAFTPQIELRPENFNSFSCFEPVRHASK
jgi:hypothetical protein